MKRNDMDVPIVIKTQGGMEATELTRHVLKTRCGTDDSQKIALLEKIKGELEKEQRVFDFIDAPLVLPGGAN